jgi:hypothetical protein
MLDPIRGRGLEGRHVHALSAAAIATIPAQKRITALITAMYLENQSYEEKELERPHPPHLHHLAGFRDSKTENFVSRVQVKKRQFETKA